MKTLLVLIVILLGGVKSGQTGFSGSPLIDNIGVPTARTLNRREFRLKSWNLNLTYGLTDNLQLGSRPLMKALSPPCINLSGKYTIIDPDESAIGIAGGATIYNFPSGTVVPYFLTATLSMTSNTNFHFMGSWEYPTLSVIDDETSGLFGREFEKFILTLAGKNISGELFHLLARPVFMGGLETDLGSRTKFLLDAGYGKTFQELYTGAAFLIAWDSFHLKLGSQVTPRFWPVIKLWWRFEL